jgi:NDP-sugar pyrophosphorylase family protein
VKALVLAGGLGTRLRPRFGDLPKALAPVAGRPFIERLIGWLAGAGIRDIVICAGVGADQLRAALGDGAALGARIAWSVESEPLGTGGALALAAPHVNGPVLVVNGDTLVDADPWTLERARWSSGAEGALALFEVADAASRGRVECDQEGRIVRFVEKDTAHRGAAWVSGGLYAFSPRLWGRLPEGSSSLERDVLPAMAADRQLVGVRLAGAFRDIGTPEEWERAELELGA